MAIEKLPEPSEEATDLSFPTDNVRQLDLLVARGLRSTSMENAEPELPDDSILIDVRLTELIPPTSPLLEDDVNWSDLADNVMAGLTGKPHPHRPHEIRLSPEASERTRRFYEDYHDQIQRYLERLSGKVQVAEDLAQDTFLKVAKFFAVDPERELTSETGWLYRIATRTFYDYLKKGGKHVRYFGQPLSMDEMAESLGDTIVGQNGIEIPSINKVMVNEAIQKLPPKYRNVLILYYFYGYRTPDIAMLVGCSPAAVKMRLDRARDRLKTVYTDIFGDEILLKTLREREHLDADETKETSTNGRRWKKEDMVDPTILL